MGKSTTIVFPHLHVLLEGFIEDLDFVYTSIKNIKPIDQSNMRFILSGTIDHFDEPFDRHNGCVTYFDRQSERSQIGTVQSCCPHPS